MTGPAQTETRVSVAGFDGAAEGVTPPTSSGRHGLFLADVVTELGFADRETVERAVQEAEQAEKPLERHLLDSGILDEDQYSHAIAERNGLDHVDLEHFEVDMDAAEMVSRSAAERYSAVPIAFASDGALIAAVADPFDTLGISDIEVMTRSEVRPAIAAPSAIRALIEQLPEEPSPQPPSQPPPPPLPPSRPETPEAAVEAKPPLPIPGPPMPDFLVEEESVEEEPQQAAQPSPEREPVAEEPEAQPPEPAPAPATPPPDPAATGELGDLSAELRALQESARKADALAIKVERKIEGLEGAAERATRLEQELNAAQERIGALEKRLSGVDTAAEELKATTEKLEDLSRMLERSAG